MAATAGVPMPLPNTFPDPTDNVEGGFWRIAYTGVGPNPVKNWFRLVIPAMLFECNTYLAGVIPRQC